MRNFVAWGVLILGLCVLSAGFTGAVYAGTDSTCYMTGQKNVGGNWLAPPGPVTCNTTTCPPGMGDEICKGRQNGASGNYPGYNTIVCACGDSGYSVRCELIYYYNPLVTGDFFYACPASIVCEDVPGTDCELELVHGEEGESTTTWRCICK